MRLISHVNGDDDLIEAWVRHHLAMGVTSLHFVVHGPPEENRTLYSLVGRYPIHVEEEWQGVYLDTERRRRLNGLLERLGEGWYLCVDSDEFLEVPHGSLAETVAAMERSGGGSLLAPLLQRITADGSLETPARIDDPFTAFPLCSVDLYRRMGVPAVEKKHPLFHYSAGVQIADGGNHRPPLGATHGPAPFRGVLHHFKWRSAVHRRLQARIDSVHRARADSEGFAAYLAAHDGRLPTEGAFPGSRAELFRRGLLRAYPAWQHVVRRALRLGVGA
jgi:hypothetical protein